MITDDDIYFFDYCTFDYAFGDESEQLEKKSVLSKLARRLEEKGLKHVTETPDLYIYLIQDVNRNIETVYHPTVTSTTDSHTTGGYSANGGGWHNGNFIHYNEGGRGYATGKSKTANKRRGARAFLRLFFALIPKGKVSFLVSEKQ